MLPSSFQKHRLLGRALDSQDRRGSGVPDLRNLTTFSADRPLDAEFDERELFCRLLPLPAPFALPLPRFLPPPLPPRPLELDRFEDGARDLEDDRAADEALDVERDFLLDCCFALGLAFGLELLFAEELRPGCLETCNFLARSGCCFAR